MILRVNYFECYKDLVVLDILKKFAKIKLIKKWNSSIDTVLRTNAAVCCPLYVRPNIIYFTVKSTINLVFALKVKVACRPTQQRNEDQV